MTGIILQGSSQAPVLLKFLLLIWLMELSVFSLNLQMTGRTASILEDRNEFKMILTSRSMIWKKGYCSIKVTALKQESSGQYNIRNKKRDNR